MELVLNAKNHPFSELFQPSGCSWLNNEVWIQRDVGLNPNLLVEWRWALTRKIMDFYKVLPGALNEIKQAKHREYEAWHIVSTQYSILVQLPLVVLAQEKEGDKRGSRGTRGVRINESGQSEVFVWRAERERGRKQLEGVDAPFCKPLEQLRLRGLDGQSQPAGGAESTVVSSRVRKSGGGVRLITACGHPIWKLFASTKVLQAPDWCSALLCWRVSAEREVYRGQSGAYKEPWIQPGLHSGWTHCQLC